LVLRCQPRCQVDRLRACLTDALAALSLQASRYIT